MLAMSTTLRPFYFDVAVLDFAPEACCSLMQKIDADYHERLAKKRELAAANPGVNRGLGATMTKPTGSQDPEDPVEKVRGGLPCDGVALESICRQERSPWLSCVWFCVCGDAGDPRACCGTGRPDGLVA